MNTYYGTDSFREYTRIKPVAEMVEDIFAGRPADENPYKRVPGFEPLKLAYEDFMMSRQEMTEDEKKELFVRIMTTDYVPEFLVYPLQLEATIMRAGVKRPKPEQNPRIEGGVSIPKRRRRAAKAPMDDGKREFGEPAPAGHPNGDPIVPGPVEIEDRNKEPENELPRQEGHVNNPLLSELLAVVNNEMSVINHK